MSTADREPEVDVTEVVDRVQDTILSLHEKIDSQRAELAKLRSEKARLQQLVSALLDDLTQIDDDDDE